MSSQRDLADSPCAAQQRKRTMSPPPVIAAHLEAPAALTSLHALSAAASDDLGAYHCRLAPLNVPRLHTLPEVSAFESESDSVRVADVSTALSSWDFNLAIEGSAADSGASSSFDAWYGNTSAACRYRDNNNPASPMPASLSDLAISHATQGSDAGCAINTGGRQPCAAPRAVAKRAPAVRSSTDKAHCNTQLSFFGAESSLLDTGTDDHAVSRVGGDGKGGQVNNRAHNKTGDCREEEGVIQGCDVAGDQYQFVIQSQACNALSKDVLRERVMGTIMHQACV